MAAIVLLFVGAASLIVGLSGQQQRTAAGPTEFRLPPPLPVAGSPSAPPEGAVPEVAVPKVAVPKVTRPEVVTPEVDRSLPVELRIPAIGVATSLSTLGLNLDGTVQVPIIPQRAGWFRLGPTPGQVGSAVILGHVDSYDGPAVFYRLRYLQPGDQVAVSLADGAVAHFAVTKVETYPNEDFPARQVYAASGGARALQLVTCGGEYDAANDGYQSNVVIYTSLVATTPAAAADDGATGPQAMTRPAV